MSTTSNKCCEYEPLDLKKWFEVTVGNKTVNVETCCKKDISVDPQGCDCCYDTWYDDLNEKQKLLGEKNEEAEKARDQLVVVKGKRDGLKKWRDDLLLMDEYSSDICQQFTLIISQVQKICCTSGDTVKATEILLCMIRDFYMQLDKIRVLYDRLMNCIKDYYSDSQVLVPGQGFMQCLKLYNDKLEALLNTKDDLIKQIMDALRIANLVHEDACKSFGLSCILEHLQCTLGCDPDGCKDKEDDKDKSKNCMDLDNNCVLYPKLKLPISSDPYLVWLNTEYDTAVTDTNTATTAYAKASQEKESINAAINSLKEAVAATDPKDRCK